MLFKKTDMETLQKITPIQRSIANYKKVGIEIKVLDDDDSKKVVQISQIKIYNGYILNQLHLVERAKKVFKGEKIIVRPIVYNLNVSDINVAWIVDKMKEFCIKRKDLIKQLAIDKSSLSSIFSGRTELSKRTKATFFYYFLTYELN